MNSAALRPVHVTFVGAETGAWRIDRSSAVCGEGLPPAGRVAVHEDRDAPECDAAAWVLRGVTSNLRYTARSEVEALTAHQANGRPAATHAALIPIRKSAAWWALAQDERRRILEEDSRHITIGLQYLPAVARRLLHSRDLREPFDFITWFEFSPESSAAFEELVLRLRATEEWRYVEREVDIRLRRVEFA